MTYCLLCCLEDPGCSGGKSAGAGLSGAPLESAVPGGSAWASSPMPNMPILPMVCGRIPPLDVNFRETPGWLCGRSSDLEAPDDAWSLGNLLAHCSVDPPPPSPIFGCRDATRRRPACPRKIRWIWLAAAFCAALGSSRYACLERGGGQFSVV